MEELLCQLLKVYGVNDVRQTEMHMTEPLLPEPTYFKVEIAIEMLKRYKSPGVDQILAELTQAGSNTLCSEIQKLNNSIWNKEEFVIVPIYIKSKKIDCSTYGGISLLPITYKILSNIPLSSLTLYIQIDEIIG
jgi:hypothetical protein